MFTQTHLLVGAAIFARPGHLAVALAGLVGALLPDTDVWAMFVVERLQGASGCEVFHYRYWEPPWTTLQMLLNSIPAYLGLVALSLTCLLLPGDRSRGVALIVVVFASSALLHVGIDFLLHHDDARAQWMPFTDWIFRSPVSYWDPRHHGQIFMLFEIGLGLAVATLIGLRFGTKRVWAAVTLLTLGYAGSIAAGQMSGGDHIRGPGSCEILERNSLSRPPAIPDPLNIALRSDAHA
ncbi:hypothetical protein FGK63_03290 [Ruegeria sediminis]|uniref:Metal-dependent hydrolase n=2 Tax=Ruegeria sediminis TaxID=2583820 RepID=A0ABY2X3Y2_9RHOB|nr:hypothetical protein FGK63_03290 [Ruegeria sediminis]